MPLPIWLRTTLRLTALVSIVSVTSIAGLILVRNFVHSDELFRSSESLSTYLQTVGGLYAVLLAFVVVLVWQKFNDARGAVSREATALLDLYRMAEGMPDTTREVMQRGLRDYVDAVLADEWHAMAKGDHATMERVGQRLDRVWSAVLACTPQTDAQSTMYAEVITRFNSLTELRTSRLASAAARVPIAMNVLLYTGALIIVGSVYLLPFDRFWLHATVTGALAGATAHILFLIYDLDDAFEGDYQVDKGAFIRARRSFERAIQPPPSDG